MLPALLSFALLVVAQVPAAGTPEPLRVAVQIQESGEDPVGTLLVQRMREVFAASPKLRFSTDNSERRLVIMVQHVDRACRQRDIATVYAVIWTINPGGAFTSLYATATVGFAPAEEIQQVAAQLLGETEDLLARRGGL